MEWITQNQEVLLGTVSTLLYLAFTLFVRYSKKPDAGTGTFAGVVKWILRTITPGKYTDETGNWSVPLIPPPKE